MTLQRDARAGSAAIWAALAWAIALPACGAAPPDQNAPSSGASGDAGGSSNAEDALPQSDASGVGTAVVPDASAPGEGGQVAEAGADGGATSMAMPIVLTGCPASGYAAPFTIGSQAFNLIVDTGSADLGVASATCADCADAGIAPLYSAGPSAKDEGASATSTYGVGSWKAELFSDVVSVAGTPFSATLSFGAITNEAGFFSPSGCNFGAVPFAPQGIVGFGPNALATPRATVFMSALAATGIVPDLFAFELCPLGGQMWIGDSGMTGADLSGPIVYTPMTASDYYSVALDDLQLGGSSLGFGPTDFGITAVDTGTTSLALPADVLDTLTNMIANSKGFATAFIGASGNWLEAQGPNSSCYASMMTSAELDALLPELTLSMPGENGTMLTLNLTATESYLQPSVDVSNRQSTTFYCSGLFANTGAAKRTVQTILGVAAMSAHLVVFDAANMRIGFAPQTHCL
jgi:hypothetical protein